MEPYQNRGALVCIDDLGNQVWAKTFTVDTFNVELKDIDSYGDSVIYIGGNIYSHNVIRGAVIFKIDLNGTVLWHKELFPGFQVGNTIYVKDASLKSLAANNMGVTFIWENYNPFYENCLTQYDASGNFSETRSFGSYHLISITALKNAGFLVVANDWDVCIRIDDQLNVVRALQSSFGQLANFTETEDNDYLFSGHGNLAKTDSLGNVKWSKRGGSSGIPVRQFGNRIVQGSEEFQNGLNPKVILEKNENGDLIRRSYLGYIYKSIEQVNPLTREVILSAEGSSQTGTSLLIFKTDSVFETGCNQFSPDTVPEISRATEFFLSSPTITEYAHGFFQFEFPFFVRDTVFPMSDPCCEMEARIFKDYQWVCEKDTLELKATGGTVTWWNGATSNTIMLPILQDTTIWVRAANTCTFDYDTLHIDMLPTPSISVTSSDDTVCKGDTIFLLASGVFKNVDWTGIVERNDTIKYAPQNSGYIVGWGYLDTYIYNSPICAVSDTVYLTVQEIPPYPILSRSADTLLSSYSSGNQWLRNNTLLPSDTLNFLVLHQVGQYSVRYTDQFGCSSTSATCNCVPGVEELDYNSIEIYPNPATDRLYFKIDNASSYQVELFDQSGRIAKIDQIVNNGSLNIEALPNGVYGLRVYCDEHIYFKTFVKL